MRVTEAPGAGQQLALQGCAVGYHHAGRSTRTSPPFGPSTGFGHAALVRRRSPRIVLAGVDAEARPGEVTALLGPNGAGKSTLLRSLVGLQPLLGGRALLGDADLGRLRIRERACRIAVVLTDRVDAGLLTGREVAALGRHPYQGFGGRLDDTELAMVEDSLQRLNAAGFADQRLAEMSDGQRQRIMLARALVQEPDLLVLDEPTAYLDVGARVDLLTLLGDLARERQIVVLLSTHEVELALRSVDALWLIQDGRVRTGRVEELIESGAVAAVFETPTAAFDPASRTFALRSRPDAP